MTLILPNTPFYRTAENCGTFYDSIYIPTYTTYNYSLPRDEGEYSYYLQISNNTESHVLNRVLLDAFDNGIICTSSVII